MNSDSTSPTPLLPPTAGPDARPEVPAQSEPPHGPAAIAADAGADVAASPQDLSTAPVAGTPAINGASYPHAEHAGPPSASDEGASAPPGGDPVRAFPTGEHVPAEGGVPRPTDESVSAALHVPRGELDLSLFDPDALKVVMRLRQYGHEAYFVGGCVRDLLLGRRPKDFDIGTSATPNEVRSIFRNCRLIGRRFRLAHVYFKGGKIVEVSTFRANPADLPEPEGIADAETPEEAEDAAAEDAAPVEEDLLITHDNVFGTAEEDARRRDFTMNGLFYDVGEGRVIDYVRGRRDLQNREIRTIGDPERRMREDPVRILRAVRFACKLGLDIESRTYAAMEGAVEDLPRCAPPRLLEETFRLIRGGIAAPSLKLIAALDALKILLPPIDAFLKERGKDGERIFYAYAEALDRRVQASAEPLEDAILLAALLVPIARAAPQPQTTEENAPPSVAPSVEHLLNELVRTARLPRRIAERCRMILFAQKTLSGERRRRGPLGSFRRHPLFSESLTVFELSVEATGEGREALEAWKTGAAPEVRQDAPGPGGRRRRRRRRGGGGPRHAEQGGAPASPGDSGPADD